MRDHPLLHIIGIIGSLRPGSYIPMAVKIALQDAEEMGAPDYHGNFSGVLKTARPNPGGEHR